MTDNNDSSNRQIEILVNTDRKSLGEMTKEDLEEVALFLTRVVLKYSDKVLGAKEVAEMFHRKKSWVYDAMYRPNTELQKQLAEVACRQNGSLLFLLSDVIKVRESIFVRENGREH